jgi:peptidoglycan hydrolase CwlO-like protein
MSSETLLQLMEDPPVAYLAPANPAAADTDTAGTSAPDADPPAPSPALPLPQRRLLAARDINVKIEGLEKEIAELGALIAGNQSAVGEAMSDLQGRSASMMADMLRVSHRLEKDRQLQGERQRTLDLRLTGSINELGREIDASAAMLQAQKDSLARLQDSHETLQRLHAHLDKVVDRQGRSLGILADNTQQQLHLTRSHIESLEALYREQQQALLTLSSDHELLTLKSGQLEARVTGIDTVLTESIGATRLRFRRVAAGIAVLAVISLGLITYFQLYPSAVPETVRQQLAGLSSGLSQQSSSSDALRAELGALQASVASLDARLERQADDIANLRGQARQTSRQLQEIHGELAAIKAELAPEAAPAADTLVMNPPVALPGTRPEP